MPYIRVIFHGKNLRIVFKVFLFYHLGVNNRLSIGKSVFALSRILLRYLKQHITVLFNRFYLVFALWTTPILGSVSVDREKSHRHHHRRSAATASLAWELPLSGLSLLMVLTQVGYHADLYCISFINTAPGFTHLS